MITLIEAAQIVGCDASTLARAARLGHLKATKFGNTWGVTRSDLDSWLESDRGYKPQMKRR